MCSCQHDHYPKKQKTDKKCESNLCPWSTCSQCVMDDFIAINYKKKKYGLHPIIVGSIKIVTIIILPQEK